jgi:hypothetical protein
VARAVESLGKQVDAINKEIVVVKETLVRIKQGVDAGSRAEPATPGAWWALGVVGVLFVIMWGVVSVLREAARVNEVLWASAVKAVVADQQKPANQALIDKVEDLRKLAEKVPPFGGRELWTAILREAFPIVRRNAQR